MKQLNKFKLLWYSHPRTAVAFFLIFINLIIIAIFTAILSIVSHNPFFDELAYLFTYTMCSDGIYDFVNDQEDVICFVVKMLLTVVQMIIFSGALIGFTTDILQSTIDKRMRNVGKLNLRNHFVFLNWSPIGPNLVYDLTYLDGEKNIVILCEDEQEDVLNSIQNIFTEKNRKMKDINILVKKGNPNSLKHLSDISLENAKYIGILAKDMEDDSVKNISIKDLDAFKNLMSILHMGSNASVVVEVENNEAAKRIEMFIKETAPESADRVSVFAHNSVIGHVLGRAVINPIYSHLFHQVLSYEGCEFYAIKTEDIETALYKYNDCIPIINYDDDGNMTADQLYILAEDSQTKGERPVPKNFVKPLEYNENIEQKDFTLIIFAGSNRSGFVVEEIEACNERGNNIKYEIHSFDEDVDELAEHINAIDGEKRILLLSSEWDSDVKQDADIFILLLSLKNSKKLDENIPIFAEIVNPRNLVPMQNLGVVSVIVSNKIISLYMMQLMTHIGSRRFYRDIIVANSETEGGNVDFEILKAKEVLTFKEDRMSFGSKAELVQSFYIASGKTRMCVGMKKAGAPVDAIEFFCNKMDEQRELVLQPDDELILIKY